MKLKNKNTNPKPKPKQTKQKKAEDERSAAESPMSELGPETSKAGETVASPELTARSERLAGSFESLYLEDNSSEAPETPQPEERPEIEVGGRIAFTAKEWEKLRECIAKAIETKDKLSAYVKDCPNTKVDIKRCVEDIDLQMVVMENVSAEIKLGAERRRDEEICKLEGEIGELRTENDRLRHRLLRIAQAGRAEQEEEFERSMEEARESGDYGRLLQKRWKEEWYESSRISNDFPLDAGNEKDLALIVVGEGRDMASGIARLYGQRFPELSMLKDEEAGYISISSKTKVGDRVLESKRNVFKATAENTEDRSMLLALNSLRAKIEEAKGEAISLPALKGLDVDRLRKMVEVIFRGSAIIVFLHSPRLTKDKALSNKEQQRGAAAVRKKESTILLSQGGKSYSECLKDVRRVMKEDPRIPRFKAVRKIRDGKMMITLDKDEGEGRRELIGILKSKIAGIQMGAPREGMILHIKGMDAIVERGEIEEAIRAVCIREDMQLDIGELRPSFGECRAVTIKMDKDSGRELAAKQRIEIGPNLCRIEERVEVVRCYRCCGHGHFARDCNGPDRSGLCWKCGSSGHGVKACENEERCPICEKRGHRAGTAKCKNFQDALRAEKMRVATSSRAGGGRDGRENADD